MTNKKKLSHKKIIYQHKKNQSIPILTYFGIKTIYQPLELKIKPKVGILRPNIMLKNFLTYPKTSLKYLETTF